MKLEKKRALAARTLGVGQNRIVFNSNRLAEIKEAITKQDIKDLKASGAIMIKEVRGRKKIEKKKTRRRPGSVKKKVKNSKEEYMTITRKLRKYVAHVGMTGQITKEEMKTLRKEIRARNFRSLSHMKERIMQMKEKE